jgi:hypothetical protein
VLGNLVFETFHRTSFSMEKLAGPYLANRVKGIASKW